MVTRICAGCGQPFPWRPKSARGSCFEVMDFDTAWAVTQRTGMHGVEDDVVKATLHSLSGWDVILAHPAAMAKFSPEARAFAARKLRRLIADLQGMGPV